MTTEETKAIQRCVEILYATCVPFLTEEENNSFALLSRTDVPALCTAYKGAMELLVDLFENPGLNAVQFSKHKTYLRKHGYIPKEGDDHE